MYQLGSWTWKSHAFVPKDNCIVSLFIPVATLYSTPLTQIELCIFHFVINDKCSFRYYDWSFLDLNFTNISHSTHLLRHIKSVLAFFASVISCNRVLCVSKYTRAHGRCRIVNSPYFYNCDNNSRIQIVVKFPAFLYL